MIGRGKKKQDVYTPGSPSLSRGDLYNILAKWKNEDFFNKYRKIKLSNILHI